MLLEAGEDLELVSKRLGHSSINITAHKGFFDVDECQAIQVVLYPNPANDKVLVEAEGIQSVKVYDMWGQLLKSLDGLNISKVDRERDKRNGYPVDDIAQYNLLSAVRHRPAKHH